MARYDRNHDEPIAARYFEMPLMILEGLVTTVSPEGVVNVAPMGPSIENPSLDRFILRPYQTSNTYRNLRAHGEGVFHVTDDVLMLARSLVDAGPEPETRPADHVQGAILTGACRYWEFRVEQLDAAAERSTIRVATVARGWLRDFLGFNRARHAVIEAAVLASRVHLLPHDEMTAELDRLRVLVEKTGGPAEHEAFDLLDAYVRASRSGSSANVAGSRS